MIPNSIRTRVLNVGKTVTEQQERMDLMFKMLKITTYKLITLYRQVHPLWNGSST
jgi:hypothetical protein